MRDYIVLPPTLPKERGDKKTKKVLFMQGGFVKLKSRQEKMNIINALIWALAAATFAVGALLVVSKLAAISIHIAIYIVISVLAGGVAANIAYFVGYKKDKELAKRLDEEFALNDRVKTMVEFQGEHTDMISLQREDAQTRLKNISTSQFRWKGVWSCVAAIMCAAAILVTGLVVPQRTKDNQNNTPPAPPTIEFEISDDQKTRLATLIKNIRESKADSAVKSTILTELESLLIALDDIDTASVLYQKVSASILVMDNFVEEYNTYKRIYGPIRANEVPTVQIFAIGIGMNSLPTTRDTLDGMLQNAEKDNTVALEAITLFVNELDASFAATRESAEDPLVIAITDLIEDLKTVTELDPAVYSYDKVFESFNKAINDNIKALATALEQQTTNRGVTSDAIRSLISIFKLPADAIPEWGGKALEGLEGLEEKPEDDMKPGDGIIIDGIQYPSNEQVFDYYTKVICEYGKVFEGDVYNYKAAINTLISQGIADGTISPEVEKMLRDYLDALSGTEVEQGKNED